MKTYISNISINEVKEEVSRILKDPLFKKSKILSDFLYYIVHETLNGNEHFLKEYVIATEVLKKKTDFNPQLDAIVRIHAGRLRNILDEYYENTGKNDPIVISIPKGHYIPTFENNTVEYEVPVVMQKYTESNIDSKPIIAILPFTKYQKNDRLDVVCSVLTKELSIKLTRFQEIGVVSNYSSEHAFDNLKNLKDIGSHLGADFLMSGSCFVEEDNVKINFELNSISENQIVWAESYYIDNFKENRLKDYNPIIHQVIAIISGFFGLIYRKTLNNHIPNTFDHLYAIYWHNRYHKQFSEESFHETLKAVETGLKNNPQNALLFAFKAELYLNLLVMDVLGEIDFLKYGISLVKKAILLDCKNQHAYQVYAWANILDHNKKEFYSSIEKMLALNPYDPMYMSAAGFGYICVGDYEEGLDLMLESIHLNPYYYWLLNVAFSLYYFEKKEYEDAFLWAEKINRRGLLWDPILRVAALGLLYKKDKAKEMVKEIYTLSPHFNERYGNILNTFIFDKELQETIIKGLILAGVEIKDHSLNHS